MTKTQKRNARKRRAAGRITYREFEFVLGEELLPCRLNKEVRCHKTHLMRNYGVGYGFYPCIGDAQFAMCTGALEPDGYHLKCPWFTHLTTEVYSFYGDTLRTYASGPEADLLSRVRRAYGLAKDSWAFLEIRWTTFNGSTEEEGELRWLVEEVDLEAVVADVVAAVFTQGPSQNLATL